VTGGGIGAALDEGGGGAVGVVTGTVGSTTPVSPNGCRDTTVIADTTTQTATTPSTPTVTALGQAVQHQRSRDGASAKAVPSCSSRTHSTTCVSYAMSKSRRATAQSATGGSELFNFDGFVAPASFRGEDHPDAAGVILVLGRGGGVEQVNVFGDQQVAHWCTICVSVILDSSLMHHHLCVGDLGWVADAPEVPLSDRHCRSPGGWPL
jgi:hypothetical protein